MSSVRGAGTPRARGIRGGISSSTGASRGGSSGRGGPASNASRGAPAARRTSYSSPRPSTGRAPRGTGRVQETGSSGRVAHPGATGDSRTRGTWQERYQALLKAREQERNDAIRQGLIADPEKPRALADAITPVGTCQWMCAEYERVQRVVQKDVWDEERNRDHSVYATTDSEPDEKRMVKKFRRAAAGLEEQLPSDLRPPQVLKQTCDYLFNDVVANAPSLAHVHHFVWDRTRAIRNDFSIQQITKTSELRIAIECHERIVRFHILSLHQLALPERPYSKYDWQQEREQLDRTLLSLMQYYDDNQGRLDLPNEAEFRSYCVIFQLQDPTPDLEDRVQSWPTQVLKDARVQKALDLYMAACNVMDAQGPLKPRTDHLIARQNWQRFWTLVASKQVSYLMACVAEIYFNLVRRTVLNALFRTTRMNATLATPDWAVDVMCDLLGLDRGDEVYAYCGGFGFTFKERDDGQHYVDLTSVKGKTLPAPSADLPKQSKSAIVENKRFGRTLPAVIDGLSVRQARSQGRMMDVVPADEDMEDLAERQTQEEDEKDEDLSVNTGGHVTESNRTFEDENSLFVPENDLGQSRIDTVSPVPAEHNKLQKNNVMFSLDKESSFGRPSNADDSMSIFARSEAKTEAGPTSIFGTSGNSVQASNTQKQPLFNFLGATGVNPLATATESLTSNSMFSGVPTPKFTGFQFPEAPKPSHSAITTGSGPESSDPVSFTSASIFSTPAPSAGKLANPFAAATSATAPKAESATPEASTVQWTKPSTATTPAAAPVAKSPTPAPSQWTNPFASVATPVAAAAPASVAMPSQQLETPSSPLRFTAEAPSPIPAASPSQSAPASTLGQTSLRQPIPADTRPRRPSPLSHSWGTAEDNSSKRSEEDSESFSKSSSAGDSSSRPRHTQEEQHEQHLTELTHELVNDPIRGFVKQYVDYTVSRIIAEVQEELDKERDDQEADQYRVFTLLHKYGKRWRDLFWQRRLAKSGSQRRERRLRKLQQQGGQSSGTSTLSLTQSNYGSSEAGSDRAHDRPMGGISSRQDDAGHFEGQALMDGFHQNGSANKSDTTFGHKRNPPPQEEDFATLRPGSRHKRLKSTSHVDKRGRVSKMNSSTHSNADIIERSSFLGFSIAAEDAVGNNRDATKSHYFKLKAMGVPQANDPSGGLRGLKRQRSGSLATTLRMSPAASVPRTTPRVGQSLVATAQSTPTPAPTSTSRKNDEDEALFARLRAARANLVSNQYSLASPVPANNDTIMRTSISSYSSTESPSMAKAREEARLRASINGFNTASNRDPPAYRLRESKFVPREEYGKAIERAKELRASRSREVSRPQSRTEHEMISADIDDGPRTTQAAETDQATLRSSSLVFPGVREHVDLPHTAVEPGFSPPVPQESNFAQHTTHMASSNPFMQQSVVEPSTLFVSPQRNVNFDQEMFVHEPVKDTYGFTSHTETNSLNGFGSLQPVSANHTIRSSRIEKSLADSFGETDDRGLVHSSRLNGDHSQTPCEGSRNSREQLTSLLRNGNQIESASEEDHIRALRNNTGGKHHATNISSDDESPQENEVAGFYGTVNPFAALDDGSDGNSDDSQGWDSQADVQKQSRADRVESESDQERPTRGGHLSSYPHDEGSVDEFDSDEEGVDGDIDEDEMDSADPGEDEANGYYYEDEDDNDENGEDQHYPPPVHWTYPGNSTPGKGPVSQQVGNSVEEAIELSD